jgi:hypothetical protein
LHFLNDEAAAVTALIPATTRSKHPSTWTDAAARRWIRLRDARAVVPLIPAIVQGHHSTSASACRAAGSAV